MGTSVFTCCYFRISLKFKQYYLIYLSCIVNTQKHAATYKKPKRLFSNNFFFWGGGGNLCLIRLPNLSFYLLPSPFQSFSVLCPSLPVPPKLFPVPKGILFYLMYLQCLVKYYTNIFRLS